ncbi:hypothetical protein [uncultured Shewanella sp.]|uniref:hypothetical protein n=1 Tax=uncultured Shewanella sp. TaxID=173975 RepID=UPI00261589AB|nr:hypothetical protein [uncultured Shewanella sp.]
MPICQYCQKHYHASLSLCPHCLSPRGPQTPQNDTLEARFPSKTMTPALAIAIFLLPLIFSWFTLQKGYSDLSKTLSISWLGVFIFSLFINLSAIAATTPLSSQMIMSNDSQVSLTPSQPTALICMLRSL